MRSIAFAMFTPFYFIKAGLYVSIPALWAGLLIIGAFLVLKMLTKTVGVFPLARLHYMRPREATYTTLLMATGLNVRDDFGIVWIAKPHHRSDTGHHSCQHRDLECVCADADRSEIFPAKHRNNARMGTNLSPKDQRIRL